MGTTARTPSPIDRRNDRRTTFLGILLSAAWLGLALIAAALPGVAGPTWLPLHLALAGSASTAIAAVMPFFAASLTASAPAPVRPRLAAILLVTVGAALVTGGMHLGEAGAAAAGGLVFAAGMVVLLSMTLRLLARSVIARRRVYTALYALSIVSVLVGALLATLMLAGSTPVAAAWAGLRLAHAWLNLFGFVGLTVAATLVHFLPTVVGSRIPEDRGTLAGIAALAVGPLLVALGHATRLDLAVVLGALATIAGALAMGLTAAIIVRHRARWTSDPGWHRFASGSLVLATGWLVAVLLVAGVRALGTGSDPGAWVGGAVLLPLVLGAVVQVIVGSWTHLLPAIGPGGPLLHARQRVILGRVATARLVVFQVGVAMLALAAFGDVDGPLVAVGALLASASLLASLGLLSLAALEVARDPAAARRG